VDITSVDWPVPDDIDRGTGAKLSKPNKYLHKNVANAVVGSSSGYTLIDSSTKASKKLLKDNLLVPLDGFAFVNAKSISTRPISFVSPGVSLHILKNDTPSKVL